MPAPYTDDLDRLLNIRPQFEGAGPESPLHDMIFQYFQPNFGTNDTVLLTQKYIAALRSEFNA